MIISVTTEVNRGDGKALANTVPDQFILFYFILLCYIFFDSYIQLSFFPGTMVILCGRDTTLNISKISQQHFLFYFPQNKFIFH